MAEALKARLSIAVLGGTAGTIGSVAATVTLNALIIGGSFELGLEAGNRIGTLLDTLVDDLQGEPDIDSLWH